MILYLKSVWILRIHGYEIGHFKNRIHEDLKAETQSVYSVQIKLRDYRLHVLTQPFNNAVPAVEIM
jgi:hypothetical protein